jgi:hypothetical protein
LPLRRRQRDDSVTVDVTVCAAADVVAVYVAADVVAVCVAVEFYNVHDGTNDDLVTGAKRRYCT